MHCRAAEVDQVHGEDSGSQEEDSRRSSFEAGPSFGASYLYDADALMRHIGPEIARNIPSVLRLLRSLK
jgi:hypothetical protein